MRPPTRTPRSGLFVYAACTATELLLSAWSWHLLSVARRTENGYARIERQLDLIEYGYVALAVGAVIGLVAVATTRRQGLGARVAWAGAIATGLAVVFQLGRRAAISQMAAFGYARVEMVLTVLGAGTVLAATMGQALALVVTVRIGRAASARATVPLALAAFAAIAVDLMLYVAALTLRYGHAGLEAPAALVTIKTVAYYAGTLLVAGCAAHAGVVVARVAEPEAPPAPGDPAAALSPQWSAAATGIGLYLGGAAARVVCAVLGYAVLAGGSSGASGGTPDLHAMHDSTFVVAVLSGAASLTMLLGVWRITRAPAESGGPGPAMITLCLMVMGLALDFATTSITLDALGGSLSAAFFAMDALPWLAGGAALLGVGAGVALLRSFRNMARALGAEELAARARSATALLGIAGTTLGLVVLGLKHLPSEVLALIAFVVLPVALAALVQFLRVAVPLGRTIRDRLGTHGAPP